MQFRIRTNLDLYYRLFFVALFILFGLLALGIVVLENLFGINVIPLLSDMEKQALLSILKVMGIIGICISMLILYFMREKRRVKQDRRHNTIIVKFERRLNFDDRRDQAP